MFKVGLSVGASTVNDETFAELKKAGISAIEVCAGVESLKTFDFAAAEHLSKKYDIKLWSLHLPFVPYSVIGISSPDEEMRKSTISYFENIISQASHIGIDKFVVHPSGDPGKTEEERRENISRVKSSLAELAQIADRYRSVIAIEELPRTCIGNTVAEMKELLSVDDRLRVCFDTNHLLFDSHMEFIKELGDKIVTLHVSDYDFVDEKHWLPGEGKVDWYVLSKALKDSGYEGVWLYEVGRTGKFITRSRLLDYVDFYNNAMEIFEGRPLTVIK